MKYFVILLASFWLFIISIIITFNFWNIEEDWAWKAFMIFCPANMGYILIKNLQNYSRIQHYNNELHVTKIFSSHTYDLNDLKSWTVELNFYRVRYLKLKLIFTSTQLTLIDHVEPTKIEQFYHYLRTRHRIRMKQL